MGRVESRAEREGGRKRGERTISLVRRRETVAPTRSSTGVRVLRQKDQPTYLPLDVLLPAGLLAALGPAPAATADLLLALHDAEPVGLDDAARDLVHVARRRVGSRQQQRPVLVEHLAKRLLGRRLLGRGREVHKAPAAGLGHLFEAAERWGAVQGGRGVSSPLGTQRRGVKDVQGSRRDATGRRSSRSRRRGRRRRAACGRRVRPRRPRARSWARRLPAAGRRPSCCRSTPPRPGSRARAG